MLNVILVRFIIDIEGRFKGGRKDRWQSRRCHMLQHILWHLIDLIQRCLNSTYPAVHLALAVFKSPSVYIRNRSTILRRDVCCIQRNLNKEKHLTCKRYIERRSRERTIHFEAEGSSSI